MTRVAPGQGRAGDRPGLLGFVAAVLLGSAGCWIDSEDPKELTAASWGGSYTEASVHAYYRPFEENTGFSVRQVQYNGGLEEIREQVTPGDVQWDVVDSPPLSPTSSTTSVSRGAAECGVLRRSIWSLR